MACRCPFCVKAKAALKSMNADFVAVELDQMPEGSALRAELAKVNSCSPDSGTVQLQPVLPTRRMHKLRHSLVKT